MKRFAQVKLNVEFIKQENRYVAYSPALDLSTSGKSLAEVKRRFAEATGLFMEELNKSGTTEEVFKELGWKITRNEVTPPKVVNQEMMDLRVPVGAR